VRTMHRWKRLAPALALLALVPGLSVFVARAAAAPTEARSSTAGTTRRRPAAAGRRVGSVFGTARRPRVRRSSLAASPPSQPARTHRHPNTAKATSTASTTTGPQWPPGRYTLETPRRPIRSFASLSKKLIETDGGSASSATQHHRLHGHHKSYESKGFLHHRFGIAPSAIGPNSAPVTWARVYVDGAAQYLHPPEGQEDRPGHPNVPGTGYIAEGASRAPRDAGVEFQNLKDKSRSRHDQLGRPQGGRQRARVAACC